MREGRALYFIFSDIPNIKRFQDEELGEAFSSEATYIPNKRIQLEVNKWFEKVSNVQKYLEGLEDTERIDIQCAL